MSYFSTLIPTGGFANATPIPAPAWYPSYLPKFYRGPNHAVQMSPINSVPNYTENDVLDALLYLQSIVGYNRSDGDNANAIWTKHNYMWVVSAFKKDGNGDGGGNMDNKNTDYDPVLLKKLRSRYVANELYRRPYVSSINNLGDGIDLLTLPMETDTELQRPTWYPNYLPSLFKNAGEPYMVPGGNVITKIRPAGYKVTANDVAYFMLMAQPIVMRGPNPYPLNWVYMQEITGANCCKFFISLYALNSFSQDALSASFPQIFRAYSLGGSVLNIPPQPKALPGWIATLSQLGIAIATKVPITGTIYKLLAPTFEHMNAGNAPPSGSFSDAVNIEAKKIIGANDQAALTANGSAGPGSTDNSFMILLLASAAGLLLVLSGKKKKKKKGKK